MSLLKNADMRAVAGEQTVLDGRQKITIAFLAVLIIALLLPSFLPKTTFWGSLLSHIGTTGIVALMVGVVIFITYQGRPLAKFRTMMHQGVSWELIFMIAAALVSPRLKG